MITTEQQVQIRVHRALGVSVKETAEVVEVSERTVKRHALGQNQIAKVSAAGLLPLILAAAVKYAELIDAGDRKAIDAMMELAVKVAREDTPPVYLPMLRD